MRTVVTAGIQIQILQMRLREWIGGGVQAQPIFGMAQDEFSLHPMKISAIADAEMKREKKLTNIQNNAYFVE